MKKFSVESADFHRNGSGGNGFFIGVVRHLKGENRGRRFLVTDFRGETPDSEDWDRGNLAVVDLDQAVTGNISMFPQGGHAGGNAWRGADYFQAEADAIRGVVRERWSRV